MIRQSLQSKFKTDEFKHILTINKVKRIALFGSQLNESVKSPNDFDFLVEFENGASLFDHAGLKLDLEKFFYKKVDVVTKASLSKYFRDEVLEEAVFIDGS